MEKRRPISVLIVILIGISAIYLFPNIYEKEFLLSTFKFFNFLIFLMLAVYLVAGAKLSKLSSLSLTVLISLCLQILQSMFSVREVGLETIFFNVLGAFLGIYGSISLILFLKLIFISINNFRSYNPEYSDQLESIFSHNERRIRSNFVIKYINHLVRHFHFAFNKIITRQDNLKISIKTDLPHKMIFPVMNPSIIRHLLHGTSEKDTSVILSEQISPGMTVWDIGAHYGYFSLKASCLVGSRGQVLSFEPTPTTFEMLNLNTKNITNIKTFNLAFFSQKTQLTFNDYGENYSALNSLHEPRLKEDIKYEKRFLVDLVRADDFLSENSHPTKLIKMDCESSELEILKGMENILSVHKPHIVMEFGDLPNKNIPVSLLDLTHWKIILDKSST